VAHICLNINYPNQITVVTSTVCSHSFFFTSSNEKYPLPLFSKRSPFNPRLNDYCVFHVTLPNQEIDLIHYKNSKAHIFISSLRIHLKLKMWSILCIYLMSVPLLCSYITFPRLSFLLPDFEGFESSNSSQMCKSS
jgi:hypothetical protein